MSKLGANFLYEIGTFLQHRSAYTNGTSDHRTPVRMFVLERMLQESNSGVLLFYHCRLHSTIHGGEDISQNIIRYNEIELEPIPADPQTDPQPTTSELADSSPLVAEWQRKGYDFYE
jgi:hypothetical protein